MGNCIFCGATEAKLTREHLWGQWISRTLNPSGEQIPHSQFEFGKPTASWSSALLDLTSKSVCVDCNSGWLSDLEHSAKAIVEPLMLRRADRTLNRADQFTCSRWATKMAMVLEYAAKRPANVPRFFIDAERHQFKAHVSPPFVSIWIARHLSHRGPYLRSVIREIVHFETDRKYRLLATTLAAGWFALQVVGIRDDVGELVQLNDLAGMKTTKDSRDRTVRVWPPRGSSVSFPPRLQIDDIAAFADRWNELRKPALIR